MQSLIPLKSGNMCSSHIILKVFVLSFISPPKNRNSKASISILYPEKWLKKRAENEYQLYFLRYDRMLKCLEILKYGNDKQAIETAVI